MGLAAIVVPAGIGTRIPGGFEVPCTTRVDAKVAILAPMLHRYPRVHDSIATPEGSPSSTRWHQWSHNSCTESSGVYPGTSCDSGSNRWIYSQSNRLHTITKCEAILPLQSSPPRCPSRDAYDIYGPLSRRMGSSCRAGCCQGENGISRAESHAMRTIIPTQSKRGLATISR